jgi:hypothetical protein
MPFREIPRRRWASFLDDFSSQHRGCVCTLEVDSSVAGTEVEAHASPFQGAVFEPTRDGPQVQLFVGGRPDAHVTHALSQPVGIWVETTADGSDKGLRIEADEGSLLLRFRSPQPSEYIERYLP